MATHPTTRRSSIWIKLLSGAALGAAGAIGGYGLSKTMRYQDAPWSDALALAMAVALLTIALISLIALIQRPSTFPRRCGVLQIVVFLLAGLLFLAPMYGGILADPQIIFWGIVVVLAVQSVANIMLWRAADEMLRQVMAETSALAFWALQTALFLYAAAERLGLVDTISGWGLIGILMAVYLIASIVASARRGIT